MSDSVILLSHGSGSRRSSDLIKDLFLRYFGNPILNMLSDSAILQGCPSTLAFTTDSFVVTPPFFPGGDIGKLAVCGTINDLAAAGSRPIALSAAFILEEGLEISMLEQVVASMAEAAESAGVYVVAGDTKVVPRGKADGLFITTSGVGAVDTLPQPSPERAKPGDAIIINGTIADHGMAVMMARESIQLSSKITSDCAPLNGLVTSVLEVSPDVHCLRDPTRGGLATALHEIAVQSGVCIEIEEEEIPVRDDVRVTCELLGIDPLHVANEGKMIFIAPSEECEPILRVMRGCQYGKDATVIGRVLEQPAGLVCLRTSMGTRRIIDVPAGELLPRIC